MNCIRTREGSNVGVRKQRVNLLRHGNLTRGRTVKVVVYLHKHNCIQCFAHRDWNLSFLTFWSITQPYYMLCM